jgi:opacity protein-like surface antigen
MKTLNVMFRAVPVLLVMSAVSVLPAHAAGAQNVTAAEGTAVTATGITIPAAVIVSPETGGRSIKNRWSINVNIAYSSYSMNSAAAGSLANQTGSIGYLGIAARYGISEDLMLSAECDYLYGRSSNTISGTTVADSMSGVPVSLNVLLFVPMNTFGIYAGIGPVYLTSLSIKQQIDTGEIAQSGFGAGGQGMVGVETYLTSDTSLGLEVRYRHINLYTANGKSIAPMDNLSVGFNVTFYL